MTDFLVVGPVTLPVDTSGARELTPERIGSKTRSFNGNMLIGQKGVARSWAFTSAPLTGAEIANLVGNVDDGSIQPISGAGMYGASVDCVVEYNEKPFVPDGDDDFMQAVSFVFVESDPA